VKALNANGKKHPPNTAPNAMSTLSNTLLMSLLPGGMPYLVAGQNATAVYGVTGAGSLHNQRATIAGRDAYAAYNALDPWNRLLRWDAAFAVGPGVLPYEGTNLAPIESYVRSHFSLIIHISYLQAREPMKATL
jgi:hypothetical protein